MINNIIHEIELSDYFDRFHIDYELIEKKGNLILIKTDYSHRGDFFIKRSNHEYIALNENKDIYNKIYHANLNRKALQGFVGMTSLHLHEIQSILINADSFPFKGDEFYVTKQAFELAITPNQYGHICIDSDNILHAVIDHRYYEIEKL